MKLPLLVRCGQLSISFNQTVGFFNQQYYKKEPIDIFDFLHGDNHLLNLSFIKLSVGQFSYDIWKYAIADCDILLNLFPRIMYHSTSLATCHQKWIQKVFIKRYHDFLFTEAVIQRSSVKTFLKGLQLIKNETLSQVFSCEFSKVFKNIFFIEHLWWLLLYLGPTNLFKV